MDVIEMKSGIKMMISGFLGIVLSITASGLAKNVMNNIQNNNPDIDLERTITIGNAFIHFMYFGIIGGMLLSLFGALIFIYNGADIGGIHSGFRCLRIPVLKYSNRRGTRKLHIKITEDEMEEKVYLAVVAPLTEAYQLTRDKKSQFHLDYVSTYYSLTPYLEEIAGSLNSWNEQYLKAESQEEKDDLRIALKKQMFGSLGNTVQHIRKQMDKIREKEEQYYSDIENAEKILRAEAPVHKSDSFSNIDIIYSSIKEEDELMRKYDTNRSAESLEPKAKVDNMKKKF